MTAGAALRCDWCSAGFGAPHGRGPRPRYCSSACRQRAFAARRAVTARIERRVLDRFMELHPEEFEAAWADAESEDR